MLVFHETKPNQKNQKGKNKKKQQRIIANEDKLTIADNQ